MPSIVPVGGTSKNRNTLKTKSLSTRAGAQGDPESPAGIPGRARKGFLWSQESGSLMFKGQSSARFQQCVEAVRGLKRWKGGA